MTLMTALMMFTTPSLALTDVTGDVCNIIVEACDVVVEVYDVTRDPGDRESDVSSVDRRVRANSSDLPILTSKDREPPRAVHGRHECGR